MSRPGSADGEAETGNTAVFLVVLLLFVLVRGVNLSLAQMPFEGWDEYQHLAVAEYVHQHGAAPDYAEPVPETLFDFLRRHPHPDASARQLAGVGVRNYDGKYWNPEQETWTDSKARPGPVHMYQSQQGPLYYRFLDVVRRLLAGDDLALWADVARLFNVLFAVVSLGLWAGILARFLRGPDHYLVWIVLLMVATNSLYTYNYAHVANDAVAMLLFSLCVFVFVEFGARGDRFPILCGAVTGIVTGVAVLSKATALTLLPFAYIMFLLKAWRGPFAVHALSIIVFSTAYVLVAGLYHLESLDKYGLITGMQEALINSRHDHGVMDLVAAFDAIHFRDIKRLYFYGLLHEGGWSYLKPDSVSYRIYQVLLVLTITGTAAAALVPKYRQRLAAQSRRLFPLLLLLALTWAAMLYHGLQTIVAWGGMTARAPYALIVLPVVCIVLLGLGIFPRRVTAFFGLSYCFVFSLAYYAGTWKLVESYRRGGEAITELGDVLSQHSTLVQSYPLRLSVILELVLAAILFVMLVRRCLVPGPAPPAAFPRAKRKSPA